MTAIVIRDVSKSYGDKTILNAISANIESGDKIGLIGPNGCGKSTLMQIVTGNMPADSGSVSITSTCTTGYLPQTLPYLESDTVGSWIRDAQKDLRRLENRLAELTTILSDLSDSSGSSAARDADLNNILLEYGEVSASFEAKDGYNLDYKTDTILNGLGIHYLKEDRFVKNLSGGEKTRLGLSALLIREPDILLLDEPTNHLDVAALDWLENYMAAYEGTVVIISHDRKFLNRVVTTILEVDEYEHCIRSFVGNYDAYVQQKALQRQEWEQRYATEQEELADLRRRLTETARQVGHHRPMKDNNKMAYYGHGQKVQQTVSRNLKAAQVRLDRILADPTPRPPEPMIFTPNLVASKVNQNVAAAVSHLGVVTTNQQTILNDISFTLGRNEHMLIIGPNGAGKSTLLNVLAGKQQATDGTVFIPNHVQIGYIEQEFHYNDETLTVLDWFRQGLPGDRSEHVAKLLSYQLFRFPEFRLPVSGLSPGQYRKLMLAKLMAENPHMLLIDEPTNHISFDILEQFEQALQRFPGPVIAVSHDRWFIEHFTASRWSMSNGHLHPLGTSALTIQEEQRMVDEIVTLSQYGTEK